MNSNGIYHKAFQYWNHMSDCSVQCTIRTKNQDKNSEMTEPLSSALQQLLLIAKWSTPSANHTGMVEEVQYWLIRHSSA